MKTMLVVLSLAGGLAVVLLLLGGCVGKSKPEVPNVQVVKISASQFRFTPNEVRVKVGIPVRLEVTSTDVEHGLEIMGLEALVQKIPSGRTISVEFTPVNPGVYQFHCAVICGTGHEQMTGRIIIEE